MIYLKKITNFCLLISLFLIFLTPSVKAFWHNESIQSAKNTVSTIIPPFIEITAVGENNHLHLTSTDNKEVKITIHYLPLVIIGRSQSKSKLLLSYHLANQNKLFTLKKTAYPDGSFTFTIPTLLSQKDYFITITSQSQVKPEAKISLITHYQPLTNYHQPAQQKTTVYYQTFPSKKRFLIYVLAFNLVLLPLLFFLFFPSSAGLNLYLLNPDLSLAKDKKIVVFLRKNNQEIPKIYKSNHQGIIKLTNGCYRLADTQINQKILNSADDLFNLYLLYQKGPFCIKTNQIFYQNRLYPRTSIKGIIKILDS